jgi:exopolysaccharide biosynthesis polyprenyl glycosylphosphotransferase
MNRITGNNRTTLWVVAAVLMGLAWIGGAVALEREAGSLALVNLAAVVAGVGASTQVARRWMAHRSAASLQHRRLLLVGAGSLAQHLARQAEHEGYEVLGFIEDPDVTSRLQWPRGVLGPRASLPHLARDLRATQIIVADSPAKGWTLLEQIEKDEVPAQVFVVPEAHELALCRPTPVCLGDIPLIRLPKAEISGAYRIAKRVLDVTASVVILVLSAPLMLLAMLAIRITSPGPSLFWQERVGKNGRTFKIIKLRTMVADAEKDGPQFWAGKHDPRQTRIGALLRKIHLDEVPQLWNVLRGEMSLVGPRPERPCFVEQFEQELPRYADRHRVLPGITGLAQVNGFYHSSPREKLRFDLMYLYHCSLWLDISIIVRTALGVFR